MLGRTFELKRLCKHEDSDNCTGNFNVYFSLTIIVMVIKSRMGRTAHIKVKCTLVQALRLCTGHTAHRGSRGIALLFHDHGTRRG